MNISVEIIMEDSTISIDRLWAETTDSVVDWASSLTLEDLSRALRYLRLKVDGDEMTLRWRLVKFHQHCRHMHASWEDGANVEESSEFLGNPDAQADTTTGNLTPPVRARPSNFGGVPATDMSHIPGRSTGGVTFAYPTENFTLPTIPQTAIYRAPISRSTMVPSLFQGLVQSTNTRMTPARNEYNSDTSPDQIRNVGAESNNYRSPLHLSSRNTDLDTSFVCRTDQS